jgi:putative oxidoreductase
MDRPISSQSSPLFPADGQGRRSKPLPSAGLAATRLSGLPNWTGRIGPVLNEAAPYAIWFLRLSLGLVFLAHIRLNLFEYVPANVSQMFGLPPGVSAFGIASEILVAIALIIGVWPRAAALAGTAMLIGGVGGAYAATASQYGWQHPGLWIAALVIVALSGDGAFALIPTAQLSAGTPRRQAVRVPNAPKQVSAPQPQIGFAPPMIGGFATGMALALLLWHLV